MKRALMIALTLALLVPAAGSQTRTVEPDGRTILEYIKVLAADAMEGRGSGLPGLENAAAYVAGLLKSWGVEPAGENGTYFQRFPLTAFFVVEPGASLAIAAPGVERSFINQTRNFDWQVSTFSGSGKVDSEIVFVGYGIRAPQADYDDYAGLDVKGKVVLICLSGQPARADLGGAALPQVRIKAAQDLGAAAVLICPRPSIAAQSTYPAGYYGDAFVYKGDFAIVGITEKILNFIFDPLPMDARTIFEQLDAQGAEPRSFATGIRAKLDVRTIFKPVATAVNVLGRIPGEDETLKEEVVLLGAHLDGLGVSAENEVFNGADDNASGSAVVLETARLLKVNGAKPKRTVAVALWGGEEIGLVGSDYYATHPLFPLDKTVAYLNLDMVGQGGGKFQFGGVYHGPEVWEFLKKSLDPALLDELVPAPSGGGSDQMSFVAQGVPGFHLVGTRPHDKGHHPRDDIELIQPDLLARSCRFLYQAAIALGQAGGGLIPADRRGWILFRNYTIVDYRALSPAEILARSGAEKYPDVDFQLVKLEGKAGLSAAEQESDLLRQIRALNKDLDGKTDMRIYAEDPTDLMRAGSRTRLLIGLEGIGALRGDPGFLSSIARLGVKWISFGASALADAGGKLGEEGKAVLNAAQDAGMLVLLDRLPDPLLKDVLGASARPAVVISGALPSSEILASMKTKRACLALPFAAGEAIPEYTKALKSAVDTLGAGKVAIWNVDDLWTRPAKEAMVRLIDTLFPEAWAKASVMTSIYDPRGLPGMLSGAFVMSLREAARPAGR